MKKARREDIITPVQGLAGIVRHIAAGLKAHRAEKLELVDEGGEVLDVARANGNMVFSPCIELLLAAGAGGMNAPDGVAQLPPEGDRDEDSDDDSQDDKPVAVHVLLAGHPGVEIPAEFEIM